jgi:hypothetical protein
VTRSECRLGQAVTWLSVPRGGYFSPDRSYPVDGEIAGLGATRVRVRVRKRSGEAVERWIDPARLRPREEEVPTA